MIPFINIHTHRAGDPGTIAIRSHRLGIGETLPPAPCSAGIHPWDVALVDDPGPEYDFLRHADIAAVGEIGLDYLNGGPKELQRQVFAAQLDIASERGLPVIIHCVRAFGDVVSLLGAYPSIRAVFHSYIGSREQALQLTNSGHYISLNEASLKSPKTVEAARNIPPDRLFLETDDSCNSIEQIYSAASAALGVAPEKLKEQIYHNYITLFGAE